MTRLLITGSQRWTDFQMIQNIFEIHAEEFTRPITLVSGNSPKGADYICEQVAEALGWIVERHRAQWIVNGKLDRRAGYVRNAEMVALGADICDAFIKDNSPGATMTANLAKKSGIPTFIYTPEGFVV